MKTKEFKNEFQQTKDVIVENNKSKMFDIIYIGYKESIGHIEGVLIDFVKDCSTSFVSDICSKRLNGMTLSEKQSWCIVYEIGKISHMYDSWVENQMKQIESEN